MPGSASDPFYLALAPSPRGAGVATAVLNAGAVGRVSVRLRREGAREEELFSFGSLAPVRLGWSRDASMLAFAHGRLCCVRTPSGRIAIAQLPAPVRWMGFDDAGDLWCLAGP